MNVTGQVTSAIGDWRGPPPRPASASGSSHPTIAPSNFCQVNARVGRTISLSAGIETEFRPRSVVDQQPVKGFYKLAAAHQQISKS